MQHQGSDPWCCISQRLFGLLVFVVAGDLDLALERVEQGLHLRLGAIQLVLAVLDELDAALEQRQALLELELSALERRRYLLELLARFLESRLVCQNAHSFPVTSASRLPRANLIFKAAPRSTSSGERTTRPVALSNVIE